MSALHDFIEAENDIERLRELIARGEPVNSQDDLGRTPLHIAVTRSDRNPEDINEILLVVRELINSGANVDLEDRVGCTPLHLATLYRNYKMTEMLLQANADVNKKDDYGYSALHFAVTGCYIHKMDEQIFYPSDLGIVKLLLRYNPDLDIRNETDETPLMFAARSKNLYIVPVLLKKGATVHLQDFAGDTAMHYALISAEVDVHVVLELARYRCSLRTTNRIGMTPQESYFERLLFSHSPDELKKAKNLIRLFILDGYYFNNFEDDCLREIDRINKDCKFPRFLSLCYNEIEEMRRDRLSPAYSVHTVAMRGAFSRPSEDCNHVPHVIYERLLAKLIRGDYPAYCDLIAAGICSPFMNEKCAQICSNSKLSADIFKFDELKLISFYLSHFDMLNMMIACSQVVQHNVNQEGFSYFLNCSIS